MQPLDLEQKLSTFQEPWQPRIVGEFNGHDLERSGTSNTGNAATAADRRAI